MLNFQPWFGDMHCLFLLFKYIMHRIWLHNVFTVCNMVFAGYFRRLGAAFVLLGADWLQRWACNSWTGALCSLMLCIQQLELCCILTHAHISAVLHTWQTEYGSNGSTDRCIHCTQDVSVDPVGSWSLQFIISDKITLPVKSLLVFVSSRGRVPFFLQDSL